MKIFFISLVSICLQLISCNSRRDAPKMVDTISFDETKDNPDFKLCNEYVIQYFNDSKGLTFKGEKPSLVDAFFNSYKAEKVSKETGLIRVRFVVNCKGEADRFRLLGMDTNYKEKIFDKRITNQLLKITKELKGWGVKEINGQPVDYYQYLIFVLKGGEITKILP